MDLPSSTAVWGISGCFINAVAWVQNIFHVVGQLYKSSSRDRMFEIYLVTKHIG